MPRIVPSDVVGLIDRSFGWAGSDPSGEHSVNRRESLALGAILQAAEQIPDQFLTLNRTEYLDYVSALASMRQALEWWSSSGAWNLERKLGNHGHLGGRHPVCVVRSALVKCPDQVPAPSTVALTFIADQDVRESLRIDITSAFAAEGAGEWKAATVLGGAVVEALLLWGLQQPRPTAGLPGKQQELGTNLPADLTEHRWGLANYIRFAEALSVITPETASACRLAQNFRNLIHPGRVQRTSLTCSRSTALSALAAVEHVAEEYERRTAAGRPI